MRIGRVLRRRAARPLLLTLAVAGDDAPMRIGRVLRRRAARPLLLTLAVAGVVFTTAASGGQTDTLPAGQPLPDFTAPALTARYTANQQAIARAAQTAEHGGDHAKAKALAALSAPGRHFLIFDTDGRAAEVLGDLATARRVAVLVPGADTTLTTFDSRGTASPGGAARAVYTEAAALSGSAAIARRHGSIPSSRFAVIAWLGYHTPTTISVDAAATGRADDGAHALRTFVKQLASHGIQVALLCHSYGSVVCGRAAPHLPATDIAVIGSPGLIVSSKRKLHTRARVWAGRAANDWIHFVPHIRILGAGLGPDPTGAGFGARRFATGTGGHSNYFTVGGVSLRNLALIALGLPADVKNA